jgi:putative salt-induced outer membrane protein YdiY
LTLQQAKEDATTLNASAGGSWNTGNTNAYTILVGGDFVLVRRPHVITATTAFAYGRAKVPASDSDRMLETVKNLNARAKYQFFLSDYDVLVLATGFRWDPFAGIGRRNNGQAGYGRYFIIETRHRLWGELGVDITWTKYRALPLAMAMDMGMLGKSSDLLYFGRVFLGYENQLNDSVSYVGGFEGLVNLQEPGASRLNWDNALRSTLNDAFKLELRFRLAYDAKPVVPGAEKLDTATVVSILYSML